MIKEQWNMLQQMILEMTFFREARRMASWPGAHQAIAEYHDRLLENRSKLKEGTM